MFLVTFKNRQTFDRLVSKLKGGSKLESYVEEKPP
jgi:hypothetical protein